MSFNVFAEVVSFKNIQIFIYSNLARTHCRLGASEGYILHIALTCKNSFASLLHLERTFLPFMALILRALGALNFA